MPSDEDRLIAEYAALEAALALLTLVMRDAETISRKNFGAKLDTLGIGLAENGGQSLTREIDHEIVRIAGRID